MGIMKYWGALGLVALLGLSGCSAGPRSADGDLTVTAVIDGQDVRLDKPAGKVKGLALWFHGQGGDVHTRMNEDWLNALRVDGWAIASSDFHGNAWGNQNAVEDTEALLSWAKDQAGHPGRVMFVAGSMGALNSLTYMTSGGEAPDCWYGTMPVVDVSQVSGVKDSAPQISDAHGNAAPVPLDFSKLPDANYRVLASPADTWVVSTYHADVLADALTHHGREVSTLTVRGEHGHPSHFRAHDLAEFAETCA